MISLLPRRAAPSSFDQRRQAVMRAHKKSPVPQFNSDGSLVAAPRRSSSGLPWRGILSAMFVILMTKAAMIARLGLAEYQTRVDDLRAGSAFEQAGAWLLQADAASRALAERIITLLY